MAATWDEFLQPASYGGFEFEMVTVRTEGGRDLDKRAYPGVDGVEVVDTSRAGFTLQVRAAFLGDAYPERYQQFLQLLAAGGVRELVHPVHGRMQAAAERWTDAIDPEDAIDAGMVDVTFVEHTADALGPFQGSDDAALANAVRSACDDADVAAAKLEDYLTALAADGSPVPTKLVQAQDTTPAATAALASASQALEADGGSMSEAAIAASVTGALSHAQAVITLVADYTTAEAEELGRALALGCARLQRLGTAVLAARPPLVETVIEVAIPLLLWCHLRYGDSSRAADLLRLNPLVDPVMLPAGQRLVVYAA